MKIPFETRSKIYITTRELVLQNYQKIIILINKPITTGVLKKEICKIKMNKMK